MSSMAASSQRKMYQGKGSTKKTTFYLTNQDAEDEKYEEAKAPALKPKFYSEAKKIMMVNRAFLPVQRKIDRKNSSAQSDAAECRYGAEVNSSASDFDAESSRSNGREFTPRDNTYRMEPIGKLLPEKTKSIMETILKSRLEGRKYSTAESNNLSLLLSDEIKAAVRRENAILDRHKLVCVVYIGQALGQGVHITSRCLWNATFDAFSSATFQNDNLFAQASTFAIYVE